jgi:transposase
VAERFIEEGECSLVDRRQYNGKKNRLTEQELGRFEELLMAGATAHGWANDLWTAKRAAEVIQRHFHKSYSPGTAWRILRHDLGWTLQRPVRQLQDSDDAEVERWLTQDYPNILRRAAKRNAYLVFVDETGFLLAPLLRRTFAPCGCPPIVKIADPHGRISAIGAMTVGPKRTHFGFLYHLLDDNVNFRGHSVADFVQRVHRTLRGPITFLWDRYSIHSAEPVYKYVCRHRAIVIEPFPPVAPKLNPVDEIWCYVKYGRIPNYTPTALADLRGRVNKELSDLQGKPRLLASLFRRTKLTLETQRGIAAAKKA